MYVCNLYIIYIYTYIHIHLYICIHYATHTGMHREGWRRTSTTSLVTSKLPQSSPRCWHLNFTTRIRGNEQKMFYPLTNFFSAYAVLTAQLLFPPLSCSCSLSLSLSCSLSLSLSLSLSRSLSSSLCISLSLSFSSLSLSLSPFLSLSLFVSLPLFLSLSLSLCYYLVHIS